MSSTRYGVALLGFGTVGGGVYNLLAHDQQIQAKHGLGFDVKKIFVRDAKSPRVASIPHHLLTTNFDDILKDDSVDVVIEVMGGISPAREYIIDALRAGKHVVTANKKLMGHKGDELIGRARQFDRFFGYAAAVTGCHQLCPSIVSSVMIQSLAGVFNGTSNYILTQMESGATFEEALLHAQAKGYAEADPVDDIDGFDTRNKLVITSKLAFGVFLDVDDIPVEGIRHITKRDMEFAKELGFTIKLLGISKREEDGKISARVHPCFVPANDLLATVRGVCNGIQIHDTLRGIQGMTAAGAGSRPTAMAIFNDLVTFARDQKIVWPQPASPRRPVKLAKTENRSGRFYVRLDVDNHPGVLASVSKVLARNKINIGSVLQPEADVASSAVLIVMCGPATERSLKQALREISALKAVRSKPVFIRLEDDLHAQQLELAASV